MSDVTLQSPAQSIQRRLTIGMFTQVLSDDQLMWRGAFDRARTQGVGLICFAGQELSKPDMMANASNMVYELANAEMVDALVVWGSAGAGVGNNLNEAEMRAFLARYHDMPIVNAEKVIEGLPCVLTDTYESMRQVLDHLIEMHGRQRIVLIRGPAGHFETEDRVRAFKDTLAAHALAFDEALLSPPCGWSEADGAAMMCRLLDERGLRPGIDFDALAATEVQYAVGALSVLQSRGVAVPDQVSVVGFNDTVIADITSPAVTTIRKRFYESGQEAVNLVCGLLRGEAVPDLYSIPASLIVRRSCGCWPHEIDAVASAVVDASISGNELVRNQMPAALARIIQDATGATAEMAARWAEQIAEAFERELGLSLADSTHPFLTAWADALRQMPTPDHDISCWHEVLSVWRVLAYSLLDTALLARAEVLWQQARILVDEGRRRAELRRGVELDNQVDLLHDVEIQLSAVSSFQALTDVLASQLPRLGISSGYLVLCPDPTQPAAEGRLIFAYNGQERMDIGPEGQVFPARRLLPEGLTDDSSLYLIVQPLIVQDQWLGYLILDTGAHAGSTYRILASLLSTTLRNVLLAQERERITQALAREQSLLRALLYNVPDHIYFKDTESRFIRVSRSQAQLFGLDDPEKLVGKSDFDFFTEEHARPAYQDEQRIIATGQPIVGVEERETWPDRPDTWVSTTKMPLYNEQGQIVGTFGVSRDITATRRAEEGRERYATLMAERARRFQVVTEVARDVVSARQLEDMANHAVSLLCDRLGFDYAGLSWVDERNEFAVLVAASGKAGQQVWSPGRQVRVQQGDLLGEAALSGEPRTARAGDGGNLEGWASFVGADIHSQAALPLRTGERVIGVIDVQSIQEAAFDQEEVAVLQVMADQLAVAIENIRLLNQMQQTVRELQVASGRYTREAWQEVPRAGYRYHRLGVEPMVEPPMEAAQALQSGQPLVSTAQSGVSEGMASTVSTLAVPVKLRDEVIGVLNLRFEGGVVSSEVVSLVQEVADRLALSLESARLLEDSQRRSIREQQLREISVSMQARVSLDALMQMTITDLARVLNVPSAFVQLNTKSRPAQE